MKKETLEKKLKECKEQLKANSKDAHFASNLIDRMLSYKGQLGVEPIEFDCGTPLEGQEFKGETFEIVKTTKGAVYKLYGGYVIFVEPQNKALYETLCDYIDHKEEYEQLEGEMKEQFALELSAMAYCLNVPLFCFNDAEFTFKIATEVIDYLKSTFDELMGKSLQEENIEEDNEFKEATLALEELKEQIAKESE
jgi:hypothetical protein